MRPIRLLFLAWVALSISSPAAVFAASGLKVVPPVQDIALSKEQATATGSITITNSGTTSQSLQLSLSDLDVALPETKLATGHDLAQWLHLEKNRISLAPGESAAVGFSIVNDSLLTPGGHYGVILATPTKDGPVTDPNNQVDVNQALAALVFVKKTGGEQYGLQFVQADAAAFSLGLPKDLSIRFSNTGNVHVVPRGRVELYTPSGKLVSVGILNEDSKYLLPGQFLNLPVHMRLATGDRLPPGKYKLVVAYRYEGNDAFTTETSYVYVADVWQIIAFGAAFLLIIGYVVKTIRRRKRGASK